MAEYNSITQVCLFDRHGGTHFHNEQHQLVHIRVCEKVWIEATARRPISLHTTRNSKDVTTPDKLKPLINVVLAKLATLTTA